jgi:hypothetical protein
MNVVTMSDDSDWLDLRDTRSIMSETPKDQTPPTTDINKAFDDIAALFEVYPTPPKETKRGKTSHLNTRKTKSK